VEFATNFNKISKTETNLIYMQICVLDMLLEQASGEMSQGFKSLKEVLDHKLLEESFKTVADPTKDVEMVSDTSNTGEKVEKLRKMFDSIMVQPIEIEELQAHTQLFKHIFSVMQEHVLTIPYFLIKNSDLEYNQSLNNSGLVMHLSSICKQLVPSDSGLATSIREFEASNKADLDTLLANLSASGDDFEFEDVHQNAYKEMLLIVIDNKVAQATRKTSEPAKKGGVKFEIVVNKGSTEMIMDNPPDDDKPDQSESVISSQNLDQEQLDSLCFKHHTFATVTQKIEVYKNRAIEVAKNIISFVVRESR
jgi:hypothetical protein